MFIKLKKKCKCETQNQAVLVGVVSRGKGCARKNAPKIYTRVKTYIKWIKSITKKKGKCYKKSAVSNEINVLENKPGKYHDHVDKELKLGTWLIKCQINVVAQLFNLKKKSRKS